MTTLTQGLYTQFIKPQASGGRVIPLAGGFCHVGVYGSDPTLKNQQGYINHLDLYFIDLQGNKVDLENPVQLNSAGITSYNGQPIQVSFDESLFSISITDANNNTQPGYQNYRMSSADAFSQMSSACQEFGLPLSDADVKVKYLEQGITITGVIGLIASDGSLWFNNGIAGIVTNVPSPMLGVIEVDGSNARLVKKRDENRYQAEYDYSKGNIVIGSDNNEYYCNEGNGPSLGGAVNPVGDESGKWNQYPYKKDTDTNGLTYQKWFDGSLYIYGDVLKDNKTPGAKDFKFKIEFKEVPSATCSGLRGAPTRDAKIFGLSPSALSIVVTDNAGNLVDTTGNLGLQINGAWK